MTTPEPDVLRWAVQWRSENRLDGKQRHFMWNYAVPHLFKTRKAARALIKETYGYIATRADLRREPHGWRLPQAVKVYVRLVEVK